VTSSRILTIAATAAFAIVLASGCRNGADPEAIPGDHPRSAAVAQASPSESPIVVETPAESPDPPPSPTPAKATTPAPHKTSPRPRTNPTVKKSTPPPAQQGVHPGAFCAEHWAYGYTVDHVRMQCKTSATDSRFRWRKA
jgi:hypothetical protein